MSTVATIKTWLRDGVDIGQIRKSVFGPNVDTMIVQAQQELAEETQVATQTAVAVMEPEQPESELASQIRILETVNKELMEGVPGDIEIVLPEIPADASDEKKLEVLHQINEKLVDAINAEEERREQEEKLEEQRPKFGSGLAVPMDLEGHTETVWVDENQVDIDTGKKLNLSPDAQKIHREKLEARRTEIANEAVAETKELHSHYAMTREEYDLESEKEFPVYILPKQPGPAWDDSILYGDAGRLVRKAAQYNEAHPAGMLVDLVVSLGSIIGRGPYFNVGATKHYTNEFMARVGDSSKSRKGTGRDMIDQVLKLVDPDWFNRVEGGFGSGEAIINSIRDDVVESKLNHRTGNFENKIVPGIKDKRLCIREGELASIFVLAGKPESRADIVLRDGWDGKPLRNVVKGKGKDGFSNSAKCEEPHLSISADTTIHELRRKMPVGADENGFGNRFLYVYVYRVKDCPQNSPALDWSQEIVNFQAVVKFARQVKYVSMSDQARKWWNNNYARFEREGPEGLAGKMTNRASAHIRRIAMLYALIDMSDTIELEHFKAAEKLWNYCEESAMFIFGGVTREQLHILKWIEHRDTATFNQVRDELYHRNRLVGSIRADLDNLVKAGKLAVKNGVYVVSQNVGRLVA
jgi:hypothetical protein